MSLLDDQHSPCEIQLGNLAEIVPPDDIYELTLTLIHANMATISKLAEHDVALFTAFMRAEPDVADIAQQISSILDIIQNDTAEANSFDPEPPSLEDYYLH